MGFLDNLENSLNNMERQEERDPGAAARARQAERSRALSVQAAADQLRDSEFTKKIFDAAAVAGHRIRAKIYVAWVEKSLRLEVRGRVLLLEPTRDGVMAEYTKLNGEAVSHAVDLASDPAKLLDEWLEGEQLPAKVNPAVLEVDQHA